MSIFSIETYNEMLENLSDDSKQEEIKALEEYETHLSKSKTDFLINQGFNYSVMNNYGKIIYFTTMKDAINYSNSLQKTLYENKQNKFFYGHVNCKQLNRNKNDLIICD